MDPKITHSGLIIDPFCVRGCKGLTDVCSWIPVAYAFNNDSYQLTRTEMAAAEEDSFTKTLTAATLFNQEAIKISS